MSSPGRVGRYRDDVGKHRPCIVLEVRENAFVIAYGTSTAGRDAPHVEIGERTVSGRALRLTNPTYFYKPNIIAVVVERVAIFPLGLCGTQHFIQLRALAELD